MKKKQKAFTLAELLVVVVIIGILAAVVLPKFTKMLEGFKTAEAEHLLEAVRNEQEARCTLGKKYTTTKEELNAWATDSSKHFDYTLQAEGMSASRKGENYSLSIPSYEDGRICCDNCEGLNKNYISCDDLRAKPDYVSGSSCAGNPPPPVCEAQPDDTSRTCGCGGHYVDVFDATPGICGYVYGTECIGNDPNHFEGEQRTTQGDGTSTCGTKVEEYACVDGQWKTSVVQDFEACEEPDPCVQTPEQEVSCGCGGHYQQTWNQAECRWDQTETCIGADTSHTEGEIKETAGDGETTCGTKQERYTCQDNAWTLETVQDFEECQGTITCEALNELIADDASEGISLDEVGIDLEMYCTTTLNQPFFLENQVSAAATLSQAVAACCTECPDETVYNAQTNTCEPCDDGEVYRNGKCESLFIAQRINDLVVFADDVKSNRKVAYLSTQVPSGNVDYCNYTVSGPTVSACWNAGASTAQKQNTLNYLCSTCSADTEECNVSCYDPDSIESFVEYPRLSGAASDPGQCIFSFTDVDSPSVGSGAALRGFSIGGRTTDDGICRGDNGKITKESHVLPASCSRASCEGRSIRVFQGLNTHNLSGEGNATMSFCAYPSHQSISGYRCVKNQ